MSSTLSSPVLPAQAAGNPIVHGTKGQFIVAAPERVNYYEDYARVLAKIDSLYGYFTGNRRGSKGIPGELTYLNPLFGLFINGTRRTLPGYTAEWLRAAIHPLFDRWVSIDVKPGMHVLSSFGYANRCFKKARANGGKTFLEAGNSHPENFWNTVKEEHRRWKVRRPPYPPNWNRQGREMVKHADYVLAPSKYVAQSFLDRGFTQEQIIHSPFAINLDLFRPKNEEIPPSTPIRVVCTGSVSLRKGMPYLMEAVRIVRKTRDAVLVLTDSVESSMKDIIPKYSDVPIEWAPPKPHAELAEHLRGCHVFALLSLEEGFARTAAEALACGLPAVLTFNTGSADCIKPGVNGEIVPIRDPQAAAEAILKCHERLLEKGRPEIGDLHEYLSLEQFEARFLNALRRIGLLEH
ncbi:glycosyltransferase [Haloferula sp. BvORR071]|uniref:glycosyltransferase family 4 protein n=1 Tax=Haloferula sp. BvORR071 TaxID=1396141 RepID=UPI0005570ECF|nr:glycosyltransferase [Haloferula sp. BvORR071]